MIKNKASRPLLILISVHFQLHFAHIDVVSDFFVNFKLGIFQLLIFLFSNPYLSEIIISQRDAFFISMNWKNFGALNDNFSRYFPTNAIITKWIHVSCEIILEVSLLELMKIWPLPYYKLNHPGAGRKRFIYPWESSNCSDRFILTVAESIKIPSHSWTYIPNCIK